MILLMADLIGGISIHAPRGGATQARVRRLALANISIHAPRGGATCAEGGILPGMGDFNSRSPWGSDPGSATGNFTTCDFNPRSPWGERHDSFQA